MKKPCTPVSCAQTTDGFAVLLDAAPARTPLGNPIVVPTFELGEAIAREWRLSIPSPSGRGQGEGSIDEESALTPTLSQRERELKGLSQRERESKTAMRLTAIACIAIDLASTPPLFAPPMGEEWTVPTTTQRRNALIEELVGYGDTDLVCYRAGNIPELEAEQETALGPIIRWAKERYGLTLQITSGVMPVKQPETNASIYRDTLEALNAWQLAVVASAAKALGSLILALMQLEGAIDAAQAFALSHLEEAYETRKWGPDSEKEAKMELSRNEIHAAGEFARMLG